MAELVGVQKALNLIAGTDNLAAQGAANAAASRTSALENSMGLLATGQETIPRIACSITNITLTSQRLTLAYLVARKSETWTQIRAVTGGTGAGATPTLIRYGLYTVAANGDLTLVASTPNDTTMLPSTFTSYAKALSVNYAVTAGVRYAIGVLVVTGATAPTLIGGVNIGGNEVNQIPRLANNVTGQADLTTPITAASFATTSNVPYLVGSP